MQSGIKKRAFNTSYYVAIAIMIPLTAFSYAPDFSRHFFAGGSSESLMTLCPPKFTLCLLLLLLCLFSKAAFPYNINARLIFFLSLASLWFLSGRTVGVFHDYRITTGWFYIPTREIKLAFTDENGDNVFKHETTVSKKPFYFLSIKNNGKDYTIFVGPVIFEETIAALDSCSANKIELSSVNRSAEK